MRVGGETWECAHKKMLNLLLQLSYCLTDFVPVGCAGDIIWLHFYHLHSLWQYSRAQWYLEWVSEKVAATCFWSTYLCFPPLLFCKKNWPGLSKIRTKYLSLYGAIDTKRNEWFFCLIMSSRRANIAFYYPTYGNWYKNEILKSKCPKKY